MNRIPFICIISLATLSLAGCSPKTSSLEAQVGMQQRYIERLEAESKRLILSQTNPSFVESTTIHKPQQLSDNDIEKGFSILASFIKRSDNVDSLDNYEFIGNLIQKINPVESKKNAELLQRICLEYTPTDFKYSGYACEKLRLYEMAFFPDTKTNAGQGGKTPLLGLFK